MEAPEEKTRELVTFVINPNDKAGRFAKEFYEIYGDEYNFSEVEFTNTLHKAIQTLNEQDYDLCLISDNFTNDELQTFFDDFGKVNQGGSCIFAYVTTKVTEDFNPEIYKELGFHAVISTQANHTDREELSEALKDWKYEEEVNKRSIDVDSALNLILKQVDDAARDLKRGVHSKYSDAPTDFVNLQTDFDTQIFDRYYTKLEKKTLEAEPENAQGIKIPDSILKKKLPMLTEDTYQGASKRVWKKLLRKHGVAEKDTPQEETTTEEDPVEASQKE